MQEKLAGEVLESSFLINVLERANPNLIRLDDSRLYSAHEAVSGLVLLNQKAKLRELLESANGCEVDWKREIVKRYENCYSRKFVEEKILLSATVKMAILSILSTAEGDVIVPTPTIPYYRSLIEECGKKMVSVEMQSDSGYFINERAILKTCYQAQRQGKPPKFIIIPSANPVTGNVLDLQRIRYLSIVCRNAGLIAIYDDSFTHLTHSSAQNHDLLKHYPENTYCVGELQNIIPVDGVEGGYLICPKDQLNHTKLLADVSNGLSDPSNGQSSSASSEFWTSLKSSVDHFQGLFNGISKSKVSYAYRELTEIGLNCSIPQCGQKILVDFSPIRDQLYSLYSISNARELCNAIVSLCEVVVSSADEYVMSADSLVVLLDVHVPDFTNKQSVQQFLQELSNTGLNEAQTEQYIIERSPRLTDAIDRFVNVFTAV